MRKGLDFTDNESQLNYVITSIAATFQRILESANYAE